MRLTNVLLQRACTCKQPSLPQAARHAQPQAQRKVTRRLVPCPPAHKFSHSYSAWLHKSANAQPQQCLLKAPPDAGSMGRICFSWYSSQAWLA